MCSLPPVSPSLPTPISFYGSIESRQQRKRETQLPQHFTPKYCSKYPCVSDKQEHSSIQQNTKVTKMFYIVPILSIHQYNTMDTQSIIL